MAGVSKTGLEIKRYNELLTEMRSNAIPIFQDLVKTGDIVDTSEGSTLGRLTALVSLSQADLWEAVQEVYSAFDPTSAVGIPLDNIVMYAGLSRNPASPTTGTVVVWGNPNLFIPANTSILRSTDNNLYEISLGVELTTTSCIGFQLIVTPNSPVTAGKVYSLVVTPTNGVPPISLSYTAIAGDTNSKVLDNLAGKLRTTGMFDVVVQDDILVCEAKEIFNYFKITAVNLRIPKLKSKTEIRYEGVGDVKQLANTVTQIATPIFGWDSVNNPQDCITGTNLESDDELRSRFNESKSLRAQNISDALYSNLINLEGVRYVRIYENETNVQNTTYGLPPHSFKPIVLGGAPSAIAQAIWRNKPLGIASEGNTSFEIFDSQGFSRPIKFERPVNRPIYVIINLTVDKNTFPATGVEDIKENLISYFTDNFSIGEAVIYSRLYTPLNQTQGHQVDSLFIGTATNPKGQANIAIAYNNIAYLTSENITVNIK